MKKLKCSSCGAKLEIEENKEYAKCNHCGTRYKLNEDLTVNIKLDDSVKDALNNGLGTVKHVSKFMLIPIIIFAIIFVGVFVFIILDMNSSRKTAEESKTRIQEKIKQNQEESDAEEKAFKEMVNKNTFNFDFEHANGTKSAFLLESTFDDIVRSNKTNDRKIALVFNGKETMEEAEIVKIKQSLKGDYEVSINYDDEGYVNKVIVNKIK